MSAHPLKGQLFCCYLDDRQRDCTNRPAIEIWHGNLPEEYSHTCMDHLFDMLTDAPVHSLYPIEGGEVRYDVRYLLGQGDQGTGGVLTKADAKLVLQEMDSAAQARGRACEKSTTSVHLMFLREHLKAFVSGKKNPFTSLVSKKSPLSVGALAAAEKSRVGHIPREGISSKPDVGRISGEELISILREDGERKKEVVKSVEERIKRNLAVYSLPRRILDLAESKEAILQDTGSDTTYMTLDQSGDEMAAFFELNSMGKPRGIEVGQSYCTVPLRRLATVVKEKLLGEVVDSERPMELMINRMVEEIATKESRWFLALCREALRNTGAGNYIRSSREFVASCFREVRDFLGTDQVAAISSIRTHEHFRELSVQIGLGTIHLVPDHSWVPYGEVWLFREKVGPLALSDAEVYLGLTTKDDVHYASVGDRLVWRATERIGMNMDIRKVACYAFEGADPLKGDWGRDYDLKRVLDVPLIGRPIKLGSG